MVHWLVVQAWRLYNDGNILDSVDPNLHLQGNAVVTIQQANNVALLCLLPEGKRRPSLARVVTFLLGEVKAEVIERVLKAGKSDKSYKNLLAFASSEFGLATIIKSF